MVTNLSKILPSENVVLDLEVSSKKRVFEQAGLIFENNCGISRSDVTDNLLPVKVWVRQVSVTAWPSRMAESRG